MSEHQDQEFVEYIIKHIVNNPDDVKVNRKTDEMGVLIEVTVNPTDMGLLIGRQGTTAKAIRILARIIGMRNNARVNLRIIEPEGSTHGQAAPAVEGTPAPASTYEPGKMRDVEDIDDVLKGMQNM